MYRKLTGTLATLGFIGLTIYALNSVLQTDNPLTMMYHEYLLYWKTHPLLISINSHRAPLLNCERPEWERVPGSYGVFLYRGESLEEHKAAVREYVDLDDAHIRYVWDHTIPGEIFYHAVEINDTALEAIRADTRVAMVECDAAVPMPDDGPHGRLNSRESEGGWQRTGGDGGIASVSR